MKKTPRKSDKFYQEDFETQFQINYLAHNKVAAPELRTWNVLEDREYTVNPKLNDKLTEKYGDLIAEAYVAPIYIQWVNKTVQYGVFASSAISRGDMICEYTGVLDRESLDNDNPYIWDYPTHIYETVPGKTRRKKIQYCVDAEKNGNYSRFINHTHRKFQNVATLIIHAQSFWHIIYIAQKDIEKGQQLLTHYGVEYWKDRQILPAPLMP